MLLSLPDVQMVLIFEDENFFGDSGGAEADAAAESGAHNKAPSADGAHVRLKLQVAQKSHNFYSSRHDTVVTTPPLATFGITFRKGGLQHTTTHPTQPSSHPQ